MKKNNRQICFRRDHYEIESGIPIPKEDLFFNKKRILQKRSHILNTLRVGEEIKIFASDVLKEKSRYTACISKHSKKIKWKFSTKIFETYFTITRLK